MSKELRILLTQRKLPDTGWSDHSLSLVLHEISSMDSNNYIGNVGVGEREGRIYSSLVRSRCYSLSHGIGRSGDVAAIQPKAAGKMDAYQCIEGSHIYSITSCIWFHVHVIQDLPF